MTLAMDVPVAKVRVAPIAVAKTQPASMLLLVRSAVSVGVEYFYYGSIVGMQRP